MSKCDRAPPRPSGTSSRLFLTLFGRPNWCHLRFSVCGIRGGKSVSLMRDQKPPKRLPFRGIKGPVDNSGLMSIDPERGLAFPRSGREK